MKNVVSVSKTYKHRGKNINHLAKTKKHWHIYYWEFDEVDEDLKMYVKQVGWVTAMYYKMHKVKKIALHCPSCNNDYWHFIKKRDAKHILNEECPTCFEKFPIVNVPMFLCFSEMIDVFTSMFVRF